MKKMIFLTLSAMFAVLTVGCTDDGSEGGEEAAATEEETNGSETEGTEDLSCDAYCTSIMANCSADLAMYASEQICLDTCAAFEAGTAADMAGNTLGCRTYHAGAAEADPAVHCTHAGPGGAGVCGSDCEGFCTIALAACTGADMQFADIAECMTECGNFPSQPPYSAAATSGDSLECRLYHLTAAASDPATHCAHIVADSPVCM